MVAVARWLEAGKSCQIGQFLPSGGPPTRVATVARVGMLDARRVAMLRAARTVGVATLVVVLASCGDDATHHLAQVEIQDVVLTTAENTAATVQFVVDAGSGSFEIAVSRPPMHGTFTATSDPVTWTYTPTTGYAGSDSVAVTASAGAASADGTVSILDHARRDGDRGVAIQRRRRRTRRSRSPPRRCSRTTAMEMAAR